MSSLIFLGFSVIVFVISFGIVFLLVPNILGAFFSLPVGDMDQDWIDTRSRIETQAQWLIPLTMAMGMFILVLKVLMVASVRGRD